MTRKTVADIWADNPDFTQRELDALVAENTGTSDERREVIRRRTKGALTQARVRAVRIIWDQYAKLVA